MRRLALLNRDGRSRSAAFSLPNSSDQFTPSRGVTLRRPGARARPTADRTQRLQDNPDSAQAWAYHMIRLTKRKQYTNGEVQYAHDTHERLDSLCQCRNSLKYRAWEPFKTMDATASALMESLFRQTTRGVVCRCGSAAGRRSVLVGCEAVNGDLPCHVS